MKLKNKICILLLLLISRLSFTQEVDSLYIYTTPNDSCYLVNLNFENHTNDTLIVSGKYLTFVQEWQNSIGIQINTYCNHKYFKLKFYDESLDGSYIVLSNSNFIELPPYAKRSFTINTKRHFKEFGKEFELGVELDINYALISKKTKKYKKYRIKTRYVPVRHP